MLFTIFHGKNNSYKNLKVAFSDNSRLFWGPFKYPFSSYLNWGIFCEKYSITTYFASLTIFRHPPSKVPKLIHRKTEKRHVGSIFGLVWNKLGQIMTKVKLEILIVKVSRFNHDTPNGKNVFYFIKKCYGI